MLQTPRESLCSHANLIIFVNHSVAESCLPNPCLNEGECINEDGKPVCKCKGRFSGQFCESKISVCLVAS